MAREHRIIAAVGTTAVPVPPALGLCTDDSVNGAPFYVMGYVDGVVLDSQARAAELPSTSGVAASEHLIDVLADLHDVDVDAVGLGDLAKRDRVRRAAGAAVDDAVGELEDPRVAGDRRGRPATRASGCPSSTGSSIAHGDYRFGNCLTDRRPAASPRCSTGSCARWATRSPTSAISASTGPTGRPNGTGQRPDRGRRVPQLRRAARAIRLADGTRSLRHRLLRRVLLLAPGGDQRGGVRPVPARSDGRSGAGRQRSTAQGRRPTRSPSRRSRPCGGWRERRDRCAGRLGTGFVHRGRLHPSTLPRGRAPAWWSCTRSPASPRWSPGSPTRWSTPGSPWSCRRCVGTPGKEPQRATWPVDR